jgi:hypothetical protein
MCIKEKLVHESKISMWGNGRWKYGRGEKIG